jgi:hypothetical protein
MCPQRQEREFETNQVRPSDVGDRIVATSTFCGLLLVVPIRMLFLKILKEIFLPEFDQFGLSLSLSLSPQFSLFVVACRILWFGRPLG